MYPNIHRKMVSVLIFGAIVITSGCSTFNNAKSGPFTLMKQAECVNCGPNAGHENSAECAQSVAVVTYQDSCAGCGKIPVTVRTFSQSETCR
jgi:hypothetical protein